MRIGAFQIRLVEQRLARPRRRPARAEEIAVEQAQLGAGQLDLERRRLQRGAALLDRAARELQLGLRALPGLQVRPRLPGRGQRGPGVVAQLLEADPGRLQQAPGLGVLAAIDRQRAQVQLRRGLEVAVAQAASLPQRVLGQLGRPLGVAQEVVQAGQVAGGHGHFAQAAEAGEGRERAGEVAQGAARSHPTRRRASPGSPRRGRAAAGSPGACLPSRRWRDRDRRACRPRRPR